MTLTDTDMRTRKSTRGKVTLTLNINDIYKAKRL